MKHTPIGTFFVLGAWLFGAGAANAGGGVVQASPVNNQALTTATATASSTAALQAPSLNLGLSPLEINRGETARLTWTSQNATECLASGAWSGSRSLAGNILINPVTTRTYNLTCNNASGSIARSVQITVNQPGLPTVRLSAPVASVVAGRAVQLNWASEKAQSCLAQNAWSGTKALTGSELVKTPLTEGTLTYQLVCKNSAGSTSAAYSLKVTPNTPPDIRGLPLLQVRALDFYEFQPYASDKESPAVGFSVLNKPSWLTFDSRTGRLSGTPTEAQVGEYRNIIVRASDGVHTSALPAFTLKVTPFVDRDRDFAERVRLSNAWYAQSFEYATLADLLKANCSTCSVGKDPTDGGSRDLNTTSRFALSGNKSMKLSLLPTARQGGKFHVDFHKWAPPGPQKDGTRVREFYLQYALYWTRPAIAWVHRDAQSGEAFKTLLLEGYGNGQLQPGMSRKIPIVTTQMNGQNGASRVVRSLANSSTRYAFPQNTLNDPSVVLTKDSKFVDYMAKHGLTSDLRKVSTFGPGSDWNHRGAFETQGDWTRNLIDHPSRNHPYGGWGWPQLRKPKETTFWQVDGWTVVEIYVKQDPTILGYTTEGKAIRNPVEFKIWAAPYGEAPRLIVDWRYTDSRLAYNDNNYEWFRLLFYDTNIVEGGGFGAKVDGRTFTPTTEEFEIIFETKADSWSNRDLTFRAIENPSDKTVGKDNEFLGNRLGINTGPLKGQLVTVTGSKYIGLVQDGVDDKGQPVMKHKTRLKVTPLSAILNGGYGSSDRLELDGDYLQVQTWAEEGYRPPLDIYYDEILLSYHPIPFPGQLNKALPDLSGSN
jgi:hypothetical protein